MLGKVDGTEGVCARFFVGTPTAVKYVPLAESQIPLVGLFTGVQTLYTPLRQGNHVRASYFDETREEVDGLLKTLHYRKIAVINPDDAFGKRCCKAVDTALKGEWRGAGGNSFICAAVK